MKSVLLCLATEKGLEVLDAAAALAEHPKFHACTFRETCASRSFAGAIRQRAAAVGFPHISWHDFHRDPIRFVDQEAIDGILCVGWRYLIPREVVRRVGGNVVIAHDSLLPRLRGFAPLVVALILGDKQTGVSFFRAGPGVDDGDILWQSAIDIGPADTIADLIGRLRPLYRVGADMFFRGVLVQGRPQDPAHATYSIWRDEEDYWIDWQQDAQTIARTIRALGDPYPGARCRWNDKTVTIYRAEVVPEVQFGIRQPGKVWSLDADGRPTVVCGRGLLRIVSASCDGRSIIPMRMLRVRLR